MIDFSRESGSGNALCVYRGWRDTSKTHNALPDPRLRDFPDFPASRSHPEMTRSDG